MSLLCRRSLPLVIPSIEHAIDGLWISVSSRDTWSIGWNSRGSVSPMRYKTLFQFRNGSNFLALTRRHIGSSQWRWWPCSGWTRWSSASATERRSISWCSARSIWCPTWISPWGWCQPTWSILTLSLTPSSTSTCQYTWAQIKFTPKPFKALRHTYAVHQRCLPWDDMHSCISASCYWGRWAIKENHGDHEPMGALLPVEHGGMRVDPHLPRSCLLPVSPGLGL